MPPTASQVHIDAPMGVLSIGFHNEEEKAEIDLTPPQAVRDAARRGLELRRKWGRGGLSTQEAGEQGIGSGVARARDLASGKAVSRETISMMVRFFSRHKKNYRPDKKEPDGGPTAGTIAYMLWGGPVADRWSRRVYEQLQEVAKANHHKSFCMMCKKSAPTNDVLWDSGRRRAWFCDDCYPAWSGKQDRNIVMFNRVESGQVPARFNKMKHSPVKKYRINGVVVTLDELVKAWRG